MSSLAPRSLLLAALTFLAGCKIREDGLVLLVTAEDEALIRDGVGFIGDPRIKTKVVSSPAQELERYAPEQAVIALTQSAACGECFRVDGTGTVLHAKGGGVLGKQYALYSALESLGYRFVHPRYTKIPTTFLTATDLGRDFSPDVKKRRGLHLHTLHPIETLYDFWIPSEANLEGGKRAIDFLIKNRGNYLQWCALDDIVKTPSIVPAWRAHTRALNEFAGTHGVDTGIAIQLFGMSNLQNAFDLIDDTTGDPVPELERRLHLILDGNGFDSIALSFGEFFGADPARFVSEVNTAYAAMQRVQPGVEVTAAIHVGNYDNLRVDFMGERQLYYFLVRYADSAIVPWVHTTMYFNLYEDAGLAYLHEEFDEHRAYLEGRIRAGQRVGYYPESAYWVAFDINIPTFVPLYMRSRHLDLQRIQQVGPLDDHVLFSSGWEWGYWLTDAMTVRMSYSLPEKWSDSTDEFFAAWGEKGINPKELVLGLGEAQHQALIIDRLAAYVASRDQIIDTGDRLGIFSQPDRPEFSEVLTMTPAQRDAFKANVVAKLFAHASELATLEARAQELLPVDDPVMMELKDGVEITTIRVRFIHALYAATVAHAEGNPTADLLELAESELAAAETIVARRRRALWDPDPKTILRDTPNPTFYQYGYLREGDTLCFWKRERAQARNAILQVGISVPGCVL